MNKHQLINMPCGSKAVLEEYSYRCLNCFAVVGSLGMPNSCKEEVDRWTFWQSLGGEGWDYESTK